jgi:hypothetical protein
MDFKEGERDHRHSETTARKEARLNLHPSTCICIKSKVNREIGTAPDDMLRLLKRETLFCSKGRSVYILSLPKREGLRYDSGYWQMLWNRDQPCTEQTERN